MIDTKRSVRAMKTRKLLNSAVIPIFGKAVKGKTIRINFSFFKKSGIRYLKVKVFQDK